MAEVAEIKSAKPNEAKYWEHEIKSAEKRLRTWRKYANDVVNRYTATHATDESFERTGRIFRLNILSSNVNTLLAMLYSNLPKIDVTRTNQDPNDDMARVAGDILERLLNLDVQDHGEEYDSVLKGTLQDRLLPGLGCGRVRYEVETEMKMVGQVVGVNGEIVEEGVETEVTTREAAPIDYFHWQDVLWGWCRDWAGMPWLGYASYLTKEEASEEFDEETANTLTYRKMEPDANDKTDDSDQKSSVMKAKIWEIWDKENRMVRFWSEGCTQLLKSIDDPLGLKGFYPSPPFFIANPTTKLYVPTPDFKLAEDLYNEIDVLQTRISIITEAIKVVGVYDASAEDIGRMMDEAIENELIPVDNWALFAEKGGVRGQIDWLPIAEIAQVLDKLRVLRDETIGLLQEITGMSDVMRGNLSNQYEGVGQTQIKAQAGSARVQSLQDDFAEFATNLMQIKAEIICKHFSPETILKQSNVMASMNAPLAPQAVMLLKQPDMAYLRIQIRSETMAQIDYAKLKQERTEWLNAFSMFLQSAAPLIAEQPESMPFLLQMLQWTMAGLKGSNEIEGVLDQMIAEANNKAQQPQQQPDPEQVKQQGEMAKIQAKAQADMQIRQQDLQADIQTEQARSQAKIQETLVAGEVERQNMLLNGQINAALQQEETQGNIAQTNAAAEAEVRKTAQEALIELEKDEAKITQELRQKAEADFMDVEKLAEQKLIEDDADALQRARAEDQESD